MLVGSVAGRYVWPVKRRTPAYLIALPRLFWLVTLLWGCHRTSPPQKARPLPKSLQQLSSPTAFDVHATPFGASVVWATPGGTDELAQLHALDVGSDAYALGPLRGLTASFAEHTRIADLVIAGRDSELDLAWLEVSGHQARVHAKLGDNPILDLGPGYFSPHESRGNIALTAELGPKQSSDEPRSLLFVRGPKEPCESPEQSGCFSFRFHRLPDTQPTNPALALSVPVPCPANATMLASTKHRWYYAVCTADKSGTLTTLFTIEPATSYAEAREVFRGCVPLGALEFGHIPTLVGLCEGKRTLLILGDASEPPRQEVLDPQTTIRCGSGSPGIQAGRYWFPLSDSQSGLELLLGSALVPAEGRAVWTGGALLVAYPAPEFSLKRFVCIDGKLRAQGGPLDRL